MKKLILIFSILIVSISCNNDDDNNIQQNDDTEPDHEIVAKWKLTKLRQFGPSYDYDGEILWTFNSDETVNVVIADGTDVSANLPLNSSGIYPYVIEIIDIDHTILTLDGTSYLTQIVDSELTIEDSGGLDNDGMQLTLELVD